MLNDFFSLALVRLCLGEEGNPARLDQAGDNWTTYMTQKKLIGNPNLFIKIIHGLNAMRYSGLNPGTEKGY